ncbi:MULTISPECIES: hypothetical protein [unclassified Oceanispirochaeta]|uniref:hypothetical protein n=1 Tax=unclassified Oceanispirochaeta TaxID=2635722 RepID=UPI000E0976A0|nr:MULTISPECIES: hypothetical protein [unclassified Oceanispirochaeta]MBF9014376.1 hypothetical protein [Oceanispirochaeta sp. M2]NPD71262.1 hypothetical protein [Oceanispirochaeta sp. M1]RDG33647.1 hypothetical protein DV872_04030 [Oceanispirochaeta sp. M1]
MFEPFKISGDRENDYPQLIVPISKGDEVLAVLDIDSPGLSRFDVVDAMWMEQAVEIISRYF